MSDRLEERGPVDYREAVYAGGWQMFLERPLTGWGFHQMPGELPRHVSGYNEKVMYPHNTYLELLVEHGVVGLALYLWLMWEMWRLGRGAIPAEERNGFLDRQFHRMWPILLAVYWVNAAMVVMSYQFVNGLLFTDGGNAGGAAAQGGGFAVMLTVAYLANRFPSAVEPYVIEEIEELRRRGVRVIAGSVRKPRSDQSVDDEVSSRKSCCSRCRSSFCCGRCGSACADGGVTLPLIARVVFRGSEGPIKTGEGSGAHLAGRLLRGAAEGPRGRPHPCTSRIFRFVDCDGGGAPAGRGIQHDAPRV